MTYTIEDEHRIWDTNDYCLGFSIGLVSASWASACNDLNIVKHE